MSSKPNNADKFVSLRRHQAAWSLLASRNAPLTLATLQSLIDAHPGGIAFDEAVEQLTGIFEDYISDSDFDTGDNENLSLTARKELRKWIKHGLVVEREGDIIATDALQRALGFINGLEDRAMTSTASRLATVQREIESLEARLSPNQEARSSRLKERIHELELELEAVNRGDFEVLDGVPATEGIREVYQLAVSLRADFRRVEDSYREADLSLRRRIISEEHNRGQIVDELLSGNEELVNTPEGQVFEGFYDQLKKSDELGRMKTQLRGILENKNADQALGRKQRSELSLLVSHLVSESSRVIQARARSERDVRGFLASGLAEEQVRVGAVLQELFQIAESVPWENRKICKEPSPLPPIAISIPNLPLTERLLVKELVKDDHEELDLTEVDGDPASIGDEFWSVYNSLDRTALYEQTLQYLKSRQEPHTLSDLANALPFEHDLETLAFWLTVARQAEASDLETFEEVDSYDAEGIGTRFKVPLVLLTGADMLNVQPEDVE